MRKLLTLSLKEVLLTFRDVGALVTMLVTPLALTLAMAAAFGTGNSDPIADIPVLLLNQDSGSFSQTLIDIFDMDSVRELVNPEMVTNEAAARARVEADEVAALVIIPPNFSERVFPLGALTQKTMGVDLQSFDQESALSPEQLFQIATLFAAFDQLKAEAPATLEIYSSPDWQISVAVVKSILTQGLESIHIQVEGITTIIARLAADSSDNSSATTMGTTFQMMSQSFETGQTRNADLPVKLTTTSATGRGFSWLGYYASSMAVLFLMFAVTSGGRTLMAERENGTLPRLLVSPTPALTILIGKMGGIILTGVLQVLILWGATSLIGAHWGNPLGVIVGIVLTVACASSVGAVISAWAKTPGQASSIGAAITLIGGALSGSFFVRWNLPSWVQYASLITPNAWGIEVFARLQAGRGFDSVLPWFGGMLTLTVVYYALAMFGFRRQFE